MTIQKIDMMEDMEIFEHFHVLAAFFLSYSDKQHIDVVVQVPYLGFKVHQHSQNIIFKAPKDDFESSKKVQHQLVSFPVTDGGELMGSGPPSRSLGYTLGNPCHERNSPGGGNPHHFFVFFFFFRKDGVNNPELMDFFSLNRGG